MTARRQWGAGSVRKRGRVWYIRVPTGSGRIEIKTKAKTRREAEDMLKVKIAQRIEGFDIATPARVRVRELYEDMVDDYRRSGKTIADPPKRWRHIGPVFGGWRVRDITSQRLALYIDQRRDEGAADATIQRELAALRRMFNLGRLNGKVVAVPKFPTIRLDNARQGFFEADAFEAIRDRLPARLRPLVTVAYWTGMRRGELLSLDWRNVDLERGLIRVEAKHAKTRTARIVPLVGEGLTVLRAWRAETPADVVPVFHRNGRRIRNFYGAWRKACAEAGHPGMLLHDFRRTAVRNMRRAGVSESVAMKVTGHKTRSMLTRYDIVDERDFAEVRDLYGRDKGAKKGQDTE